jgi:hypothetical protein
MNCSLCIPLREETRLSQRVNAPFVVVIRSYGYRMFWGGAMLVSSLHCTSAAARRLRILVTQHRVVEHRWRRYGGAQVRTSYHICRVQCALPAQPVTAPKIRPFLRPSPFPRREDTAQYVRTPFSAAASCFNNAPTTIQTFEHPQARDMASGYGDPSSSSQLFPLFGKLRCAQKTNFKKPHKAQFVIACES